MSQEQTNTDYFNSMGMLAFIMQWKKHLVIIAIAAAVLSAGASFLVQPMFKASVIMFPTSTNSTSGDLFRKNDDFLRFGEEEEVEQMLQILNSTKIREFIASKYDLYHHYEIDQEDEFKQTLLAEEYESNISFEETKFLSIKIEVYDRSADTAALIANDIAAFADTVLTNMQYERAVTAYEIVSTEYNDLSAIIKSNEDALQELRLKGVLSYEEQIAMLTRQYGRALVEEKPRAAQTLKAQLDTIAKYGKVFNALTTRVFQDENRLAGLRANLAETKVDMKNIMPHKFIVNNAIVPEKKAYPIRWLIVLVSTIASVMMGVFSILAMDSLKKLETRS